jgi:hypothetical protein
MRNRIVTPLDIVVEVVVFAALALSVGMTLFSR